MDNFDTEKFIIEIKSRPSIWDTNSQDHSNRDLKQKCWEEVVDLFGGQDLTDDKRKFFGLVLQKRWKSIRSCFAREVKRQITVKSGSGTTNRKSEYVYFKQLQFLQKVVSIKNSQLEEEENSDCIEEGDRPKDVESNELGERVEIKAPNKFKRQMSDDHDPIILALNNLIEHRRSEIAEADEDKLFLLSLLSTLKGLPPHIKMSTKIKILTLLNDASDYNREASFNFADCSFRHTEDVEAAVRGNEEDYQPGYLTKRRRMTSFKDEPEFSDSN